MARSRNIKPATFKNELLGEADPMLTILFIGLWCLADRRGRLEDRPKRIKVEIFPYRENIDVNGYLTELERLEFIHRYTCNGVSIIQVINFNVHQNPHKTEKDSDLPEYSVETCSCHLTVKGTLNNGSCPADSLLLIPDSFNTDSLIPEPVTTESKDSSVPSVPVPVKTDTPQKKEKKETEASETWKAYSEAYFFRYGTQPVRNARVNSQLSNFVKCIGKKESPHVAAFFVRNNNQFYVSRGHAIGHLLSDAEKLRTEWATNKTMTQTQARQADKKQATGNVFGKLIAEARERENGTN